MKFTRIILLCVFVCSFINGALAQVIKVDATQTDEQLVKNVLINSSCANVSNFSATGDLLTPGKKSYGYFTNQGGNFPFQEGIILNTWSATNAAGPYISGDIGGGDSSWLGDPDLEQALGLSTNTTKNATFLEFDFIPLTNFISFNYIFASNEYQSIYPCNFSDGFAFLLKENTPGSTYKNLAILPGTATAVSSQNVHPAISAILNPTWPKNGCPAANERYFDSFNTASSPINYAGQTKIMNAQATVTAGKTYHIKLVIADNDNRLFDSAVFLQAGSFSSKIDLGPDRLASSNPICFGESLVIDTKLATNLGYYYKWYKDGAATPIDEGTNHTTYTVTTAGTYKVEATISGTCTANGEIKIDYAPEIVLNPTSLAQCENIGSRTAVFDLTKANAIIKNGNANLGEVTYYINKSASGVLSDPVLNANSFTKTSTTDQTVYASVTSIYGCTATSEIVLTTLPGNEIISTTTASPIINDFSGNANAVQLIPPSAIGNYEFSLDGINYQLNPSFTGLPIGNYTAYIRDTSTCDFIVYPFLILDYPRFFTPNDDGFNDTWTIKNLDSFPTATISIFDRYGKLLNQLKSNFPGWNGTLNGSNLPADDYWFHLIFEDGKTIKGHFTLKR
jgi:gliding motility-associated-like protein